jgi:thiamine-monophosphate kinase
MQDAEIPFGPGEEFRVIRRLIRRFGPLATGIGDDAALVHVPRDNALAISTDTSLENVHFRREWLSLREIAYRATTAALSDVAAMGATGAGVLAALTVPQLSREELDALGDGIGDAVREANARVMGGDMARGDALALTFTVFGNTREPLRRDAARAGQRVYVTGRLGGPGAAVRAWLAGDEPRPEWRERFAHPSARLREGRWLVGRGARAAIDISDGLLADLGHLAAASHVRIDVDLGRVPRVDGVSAVEAARSGEEYELLVTSAIPIDTHVFADRFGIPLTEIGMVSDGPPAVRASLDGKPVTVKHGGFDHFANA